MDGTINIDVWVYLFGDRNDVVERLCMHLNSNDVSNKV